MFAASFNRGIQLSRQHLPHWWRSHWLLCLPSPCKYAHNTLRRHFMCTWIHIVSLSTLLIWTLLCNSDEINGSNGDSSCLNCMQRFIFYWHNLDSRLLCPHCLSPGEANIPASPHWRGSTGYGTFQRHHPEQHPLRPHHCERPGGGGGRYSCWYSW